MIVSRTILSDGPEAIKKAEINITVKTSNITFFILHSPLFVFEHKVVRKLPGLYRII